MRVLICIFVFQSNGRAPEQNHGRGRRRRARPRVDGGRAKGRRVHRVAFGRAQRPLRGSPSAVGGGPRRSEPTQRQPTNRAASGGRAATRRHRQGTNAFGFKRGKKK